MFGFWVAAAFLAAGASALMLLRAAGRRVAVPSDDPSLNVYRRALAEIDEIAERGLLPADERRGARAEVARRLLAAADRVSSPVVVNSRGVVPVLSAGAVAIAALLIYLVIGSPGQADQPFAARLADWKIHPESAPPAGLAAALRDVADKRPGDLEPLRRLAALDLTLGDADGAIHALRRAMLIAPGRADLPAMLGEVMVLRGQGGVDANARALFEAALRSDPRQPAARYYLAKSKIADGNVAGGLSDWRTLLASLPVADARRAALASEIAEVQRTGRIASNAVEAGPPPGDLSGAVRGMVDGLAVRLRAQPDDPAGWIRLVRAYAVLGETDKRDEALGHARARFASRPDVTAALAAAAAARPATGIGR